jgi:hypothetical protein
MKKILCLLTLAMLMGFAGSASAAGAYVGTGIGWSFPSFDLNQGTDIDEAGAFSWEILHGGYNFTDNLGVSLVFGGAGGTGTFVKEGDFTIDYLDLNIRFTYPMDKFSPYGELGIGNYAFASKIYGKDLVSNEPNLGYRAAIGTMIPIGHFYVAPEFAYNWVDMGGLDYDGKDAGFDLGSTDFGLLLLKAGYSFSGK